MILTKKQIKNGQKFYKNVNLKETQQYCKFITTLISKIKLMGFNKKVLKYVWEKSYSTEVGENYYVTLPTKGTVIYIDDLFGLIFHPLMDGVCLFSLSVDRGKRNRGIGSSIMKTICEVSNLLNIPIYLIPVECDTTPYETLTGFYHQFGFKRKEGSVYWTYKPITQIQNRTGFKKVS